MWTRSKTTALAVFALIVSSIAVAHTDGIYNPKANSVGSFEGIDSNAATSVAVVGAALLADNVSPALIADNVNSACLAGGGC